jgi:Uma2 family endonuclease
LQVAGTVVGVKTVVLGSRPPELEALIEKRRRLGQDSLDEIWQGDYHMVPAPHPRHGRLDMHLARLLAPHADGAGLVETSIFNLGEADDFRVPDHGYHRVRPDQVFMPTAAVVVEIRSPGDETYEKFDFYARHDVDEVVVVDPDEERVRWFALRDGAYVEVERSEVLGVTAAEVESQLDW